MTREDALMAMNGATLIGVADKLGIKAAANKTRTALKEAKANVIARILEAEAALAIEAPETVETETTEPETQEPTTQKPEAVEPEAKAPAAPADKPSGKKTTVAKQVKTAKKEKPVKKAAVEIPEEITTVLDDIFDKLNDIYFDSLLPKADITVRGTSRAYDCCSVKKDFVDGQYTIEVCAGAISKPVAEIAAGLMHAMVHIYCAEMQIIETCQKGRYHNGKFRKECEDRNLIVENDAANGYVYTTPSEVFREKLKNAGIDLAMQLPAVPASEKKMERT